jgi:hypothetical protein
MFAKIITKLDSFTSNKRNLFLLGFTLMIAATVLMVIQERYGVFFVYKYGSLDFWNGVNPYSDWNHPYDLFLYGPVFSIFFSVFAFFPSPIGGVLWNVANYLFYFYAIFSLPEEKYPFKSKRFLFLTLLLISTTDLFYFQFNVGVASMFLLAYSLFERNKFLQAIALILFSGFAKIYGLIQLGFLIVYKKFWRNVLFAVIGAVAFFFLPLIKIPFNGLIDYYLSWFGAFPERHDPVTFETIYNLLFFLGIKSIREYITIIQLSTLALISILTLVNYKNYNKFPFRAKLLGVFMGWIIIFSTAAEQHTYMIAMLGYLLWYLHHKNTKLDKILLWANFFIITVVPVDVLCPIPVMEFIFYKIHLNLFLFIFTWLRMVYTTFEIPFFSSKKEPVLN